MTADRITAVKDALVDADNDAYLATGQSNAHYFSGFRTPVAEHDYPAVLIPAEGDPTLFVTPLDDVATTQAAINTVIPENGFVDAINDRLPDDADVLVQSDLSIKFYNALADHATLTVDSDLASRLRTVKDDAEVEQIREAYRIAEQALDAITDRIENGVSEAELVSILQYEMTRNGSQAPAFPMIVAAGASSATPHHATSPDVHIQDGPLLFDIGATVNGYRSDMSRTFHVGSPSERFEEIYGLVLEAHRKAAAAIAPGVSAKTVDAAARDHLDDNGVGDTFKHATGHGVGLDVHEQPSISPKSDTELEPGMIVTVEPGVYLDDQFGVRIEDAYLVTEHGNKRLTASSRAFDDMLLDR